MTLPDPSRFAPINPHALNARTSGIVEVFNYGRTRPGLLPLWVGEGDCPTPDFIQEAAIRSLRDGETFYTYQCGIPALRQAIAGYLGSVYGQELSPDRFFATIGGMHALQIAMRIVSGAGDEVIVPTPAWPNFAGAISVNGASVREVELQLREGRFTLDIDLLAAAVTSRTRAICLNSPANPTGWTATRQDLERVLDLARRHKLWIIADEIYGRFFYEGDRAPSFRDIMDSSDRIMFVQTFSKNWAMTGWRIGWLEAPVEFGQMIENLIQYSSSGVSVPLQRGGIAALEQGESFFQTQVQQARANRDILLGAFRGLNGLRLPDPSGAFYLFLGVEGMHDSMKAAFRLVDEAGVGLAPGMAFGAGGEGFLRLCYLRKSADILDAAQRLGTHLRTITDMAGRHG